jgi:hypothetical protein
MEYWIIDENHYPLPDGGQALIQQSITLFYMRHSVPSSVPNSQNFEFVHYSFS